MTRYCGTSRRDIRSNGLIVYFDASERALRDTLFPWYIISRPDIRRKIYTNVFRSRKLLEFSADADSGHMYHSLTFGVPTRVSDETVTLGSDQTLFLYVRNQRLFFDTRTKLFFELPEFSSRMVDDTQYKSLVGTTSDY